MPKVSIIVPVYNVEQYISRCIESLTNQTLQDIEIILVDDGSKDNSLKICNKYAKKDKRIKVITQKNAGPSVARNNALKLASGDFIGFVDSDDYVSPETYEKALQCMQDDVDLVIWGVNVISDDNLCYISWFQEKYFKLKYEGKVELTEDIKLLTDVVPWNKLYRRSIISEKEITFPAGRLYEDNAFWWKYTSWCKNAYYLDERLHYYNMRATSLRGEVISKKQECEADRIFMVEDVFDYYYKYNLLNDKNNSIIERLFILSYIDAYDETNNKIEITFMGKNLIEKIIAKKINYSDGKISKEELINNLELFKDEELVSLAKFIIKKCEYIENVSSIFDKKHYINIKNDHILSKEELLKLVDNTENKLRFVRNKINIENDIVFSNQNIIDAANNIYTIFENEIRKLNLENSYDFLKDFLYNLPIKPILRYDADVLNNHMLKFLGELLKNGLFEEMVKCCHFFRYMYPDCLEFWRMLGDAYYFIKRDYEKAYFYYKIYTDDIKDNASVYYVLSDICEHFGDIYHQIFYKEKAIKAESGLA